MAVLICAIKMEKRIMYKAHINEQTQEIQTVKEHSVNTAIL